MKKFFVLVLAITFILSSTVSAFSAADWWQANRRTPSYGESTEPVEPEKDNEEDHEEDREEKKKESEEEKWTSPGSQSIIDWWYASRRSNSAPKEPSPEESDPEEKEDEDVKSPVIRNSDEEYFFNVINEEREDRGISKLSYSSEVSRLAKMKSQDMVDNNYFAHESPTYGRAGDMLRSEGISFILSKENLARAGSVQAAHSMLMSSSGHRSGILGERYTHVGIGVVETSNGGVMVTQIFVRK